jgi:FMN-dependent NADH-azoreductase
MTVLHLDSSILESQSAGRKLSAASAARWMRDVPALLVTGRDLAGIDELQHLSDDDLARIEQALPLAA